MRSPGNRFVTTAAVIAAVAVAVLGTGCNKGKTLEQLRADGISCTKAGAGAGFVSKGTEHCFVCPDDASMAKCSSNPLESGCKEDPTGCGKGAK